MTPRQKLLLRAIIEEFMDTAEAVGSLNIPDKYAIKASPATIRNEMAKLVTEGFLAKPHSSSGRIPTTSGLKYYLQELIEELDDLDYHYEAELREILYQNRFDKKELIGKGVNFLAELTGNVAIAIIDNHIFYSGLPQMLNIPEFQDLKNIQTLLSIIENYSQLSNLFETYRNEKNIKVLIGEETGLANFDKCAVIFTEIKLYGNDEGYLSIIGPNRMRYPTVIPALRIIANNIEDVVKGW